MNNLAASEMPLAPYYNFDATRNDVEQCMQSLLNGVESATLPKFLSTRVHEIMHQSGPGVNCVMETGNMIMDGSRREMVVGRFINDKGYLMKKSENLNTGEKDEIQEYVNLDAENDVEMFDLSWKNLTGS